MTDYLLDSCVLIRHLRKHQPTHVYTPDEFESMHKNRFLMHDVREGKVTYEFA